jgi:hypothetical protein
VTILDVWVTPSEVTAVVDTEATTSRGRKAMSKFLPVPHLGAGIGVRARSMFATMVFAKINEAGFDCFDGMIRGLPAILAECEPWTKGTETRGEEGFEVLALGWSDSRSRMLGWSFSTRDGAFLVSEVDDSCFISPWDASMPSTDLTELEPLLRAQSEFMRSGGDAFAGGKVVRFNLTRDAMRLTIAPWPERAPDLGAAIEK